MAKSIQPDRILCGDWIEQIRTLLDGCVHMVCTSPPYWSLRDYGVPGQLGLEKTPAEYIAKLVEGFREVRRVLRDDGTVWLNLGDSYSAASTHGGMDKTGPLDSKASLKAFKGANRTFADGLKPKDLCGIPWQVAFALRDDGWYLRSDIIWAKPNPMPESVTDRPTKAHEYLFLLTKKPRYFYDQEAIREPSLPASDERQRAGFRPCKGDDENRYGDGFQRGPGYENTGRNTRSVWTIPTAPFSAAHFATFPPALAAKCIKAGTSAKGCCPECGAPWRRVVEKRKRFESGSGRSGNPIAGKNPDGVQGGGDTGDVRKGPVIETQTLGWQPICECGDESVPCVVLDPFMGAGTVAVVAEQLDRHWLGIELNPEYIEMAWHRIKEARQPHTYVKQDIPDDAPLLSGGKR